jgi:multiple sugar transport system permease protein
MSTAERAFSRSGATNGGSPRPGIRRFGGSRRQRIGLLFTLPAIITVALVIGYPLLWAANLSFQSEDAIAPQGDPHYVGLDNYAAMLGSSDFRAAMFQTGGFVITTISLELLIGFPIALLLSRRLRGIGIFKLIVTLPLLMAPSVAGLLFRFLFADQYGAINHLLSMVGIEGPLWVADPWAARAAILIANLWLATPFVILVLLAGMASLPEEPFEAARVDGATGRQLLRYIMLPLLRPAILVILVVRLTDAFRIFDLVYILTGGGPGDFTQVASTFIYRETFVRLHFPQAAAASFLLVGLVVLLSVLLFRVLRTRQ